MTPSRRKVSDPPAGSWRPSDAELGWIIENRVDEAHILSWPGPLEIYVPVHDTGGYDRARAPLGERVLSSGSDQGHGKPALRQPGPSLLRDAGASPASECRLHVCLFRSGNARTGRSRLEGP